MKKKILIVEDNAQDRKIIMRNLVKHGYKNLIFAATGEEGIVMAKSKKPDLIILDINLPQMSGVQVHITLRLDPVTRRIPVIFNTKLLKIDEIDDGMNRFVFKSSSLENLVKEVDAILGSK